MTGLKRMRDTNTMRKRCLQMALASILASTADAGFAQRSIASPLEVTVNNTVYTLETSTCFAPGTIIGGCNGATDFRASSWFGNAQLAKDLSEATKDLLGLPNQSLGTGLGPNFAWQSGDPSTFNPSALPFDGFEWDPVLNKAYARGGLWNSFTGDGTSTTYWLAKEVAAPRPLPAVGPILQANNGTSLNTTASLAAQKLLPQFQGGTLMVSAAGSIADNFTVDASPGNTIDAAGNSATFTGAFTDQVGQRGNLTFRNTGTSAAITTLTGQNTYTGTTTVASGTLIINGTSTSSTLVASGATLGGSGTLTGNVTNSGTLSPGNSIGTFTINGNYTQSASGTLALEVGGNGASDLLQINNGSVTDLAGQVLISSAPGTSITPGLVYTGIATNPGVAYPGSSTANAAFGSIVGSAGYVFVRESDAGFNQLNNGTANVDSTKLQFGWIQLKPLTDTPTPTPDPGNSVSTATTPGRETIAAVKPTGGALTHTITASVPTLQEQCVANTGNASACQVGLTSGGSSGASGASANNISVAKAVDAGISSLHAAVVQGSSGGTPILTVDGTPSGYTSNQALAGSVTPDFVTVYGALFSIPTRAQLNQALHSITAEPYASMQSVALEAMEQFRQNSLSLTDGDRAIRLFTEAQVCLAEDGSLIPADSSERPRDCKPRTVSQASRWSLLIDATNTQANLDGTNNLASLDYNIFQSIYGLQYDASRQWSIGAAFGYGQANLNNYQYANATIDSDTYGGSLWGVYRPSRSWKLTGFVGYTNFQYDSNRTISFGGLNRTATANWSGNGFTTALEAEYDWVLSATKNDRNAVRLKPNTYVAYSLHSQGDITESGAQSLNLAIDGHTADSLVYGIGFTLETPIQLARTTRLIPRLSVGYEHDFNADTNEEHQLTASFADVPALGSLDVLGQNRGANDLNLALNVELETSDQFSLYAGVAGSFWSNGNELNYGGGIRWRFGGAPKASVAKVPAPTAPSTSPGDSSSPSVEPQGIRGLW